MILLVHFGLANEIFYNTCLHDKYQLTFISWNANTPKSEAITAGPVVTIGNAMALDKTLFAINQLEVAIPHISPDINPGNMARGYTFGRFRCNAAYMRK